MLEKLLEQRRAAIVKRWFEQIIASYPEDARRFLARQGDRFDNPVGSTISRETEALFTELLGAEVDIDRVARSLDNIVRIRAVQEFVPSQAVVFVFFLKLAVRAELAAELEDAALLKEFLDWEFRVDRLALLAFDLYTASREKLCEIRVNEAKNRWQRLERMVFPGEGPEPEG